MTPSAVKGTKAPKRKDEVLRVASAVMRKTGVLSTRLQDVADDLGVAYTALYHYFPSRDHLAEEVLTWNVEKRRTLLAEAAGQTALERLLYFINRDLTVDRESRVRMPTIIPLPEENRRGVIEARQRLLEEMAALIDVGIAEGSIRPCHALTIANLLMTTLEFFIKFDSNISTTLKNARLKTLSEAITVMYGEGILINRQHLPKISWQISNGEDLLGVNPELDPELERVEQIYRVATRHFNREGFLASIPRMAADLGVSKTVIYQYAIDKHDLMFACYERGASVVERSHRLASDFSENPLDEILIHRSNLYHFHDSNAGPFTLLNAVEHLKPQHKRLIQMRNRGVRETSVRRVKAAVNAGYIRHNIRPEFVQPVIGQALYGLPSWFDADYPLSIEEVATQSLMLHYQGLRTLETSSQNKPLFR